MYLPKPKPYRIVWNETPQALASMSMHTKRNTCALIKDVPSLKLVDKFTYLGSCVSSIEKDIDAQLTKAWTDGSQT